MSGGSISSSDNVKDNAVRTDKSAHICNDFLKGMCRRGHSCKYMHHDNISDVFEKGPVEDVYIGIMNIEVGIHIMIMK